MTFIVRTNNVSGNILLQKEMYFIENFLQDIYETFPGQLFSFMGIESLQKIVSFVERDGRLCFSHSK